MRSLTESDKGETSTTPPGIELVRRSSGRVPNGGESQPVKLGFRLPLLPARSFQHNRRINRPAVEASPAPGAHLTPSFIREAAIYVICGAAVGAIFASHASRS